MFLEIGKLTHHIHLAGNQNAPPVLLLHSLGTSHALWQAQIRDLSHSHFVIAPDFRGHGLTSETDVPETIDHLADDAMAILHSFGVDTLCVAGISLGGVVAQAVAHCLGETCKGLALFDTYIKAADPQMWRDRAAQVRSDGLASIAASVRKVWMTDAEADTPEGRGMAQMLSVCSDAAYASACDALAGADCTQTTPGLNCPTVVAYGSADLAAPKAAAQTLASAISGARLEEISGAGHLPLLTQADQCTTLLRSIL